MRLLSKADSNVREHKDLLRLIAFYLPQFHPIPENDRWWGKGFTEWTNVVKARPLFRGHYQPHLPADLGFYDLRLPEVRQAQTDLARAHGIHGFCYYHYWFNGKRLLERPFDEVLASGKPDFPFCLCWANENWTRIWDGQDKQVLIEQKYSEEDDRRHAQWLIKAFRDERYIRIDGKPVFLVFNASRLPDSVKTTDIWREEAGKAGFEIYLCRLESSAGEAVAPAAAGFDAAVEFQPIGMGGLFSQRRERFWRIARRLKLANPVYARHNIYDYRELVSKSLQQEWSRYFRFPSVVPGWDNSARRGAGAHIMKNSTPELYGEWLKGVVEKFEPASPEENLIFIIAWNEWAEGNHLEPCQKWGRAYLEKTLEVLTEAEKLARNKGAGRTLNQAQDYPVQEEMEVR